MEAQPGTYGEDENVPDGAKLQKELLWGDYLELLTQSRHVESVRSNAVNLVLVMTSALAALITFDKTINLTDLLPSLIIAVVGLFSTTFSLAYLERYEKNKRRAAVVRTELDRRFFAHGRLGSGLAELRERADLATPSRSDERTGRIYYRVLAAAKKTTGTTHLFWVVMPMFVSLIGIVLTVLSIVGVSAAAD